MTSPCHGDDGLVSSVRIRDYHDVVVQIFDGSWSFRWVVKYSIGLFLMFDLEDKHNNSFVLDRTISRKSGKCDRSIKKKQKKKWTPHLILRNESKQTRSIRWVFDGFWWKRVFHNETTLLTLVKERIPFRIYSRQFYGNFSFPTKDFTWTYRRWSIDRCRPIEELPLKTLPGFIEARLTFDLTTYARIPVRNPDWSVRFTLNQSAILWIRNLTRFHGGFEKDRQSRFTKQRSYCQIVSLSRSLSRARWEIMSGIWPTSVSAAQLVTQIFLWKFPSDHQLFEHVSTTNRSQDDWWSVQ